MTMERLCVSTVVSSPTTPASSFRVVIAGGGAAGLDAALALRELDGRRVSAALLAALDDLVYRPTGVREPLTNRTARRYLLGVVAGDIGGRGSVSEGSVTPTRPMATNVGARCLAPFLEERDRLAGGAL
jgi:hypothetical protein